MYTRPSSALVVFYLLFLSWMTICFSLTACAKFPSSTESTREKHQSYTIFAFALAVLITAETFSNHPDCNPNAVVVLLRPFSALKSGRIVCWVLLVLVLVYTAVLIWDYFPPVPKPSTYDVQIPWELVIKIFLIVVVWSLTVMHIELLIRWNNFAPLDGRPWQFGQVLLLFLIVLPFAFLGITKVFSSTASAKQQKHSKSSTYVSGYGPDVAGEGVQEEMPLRTVITNVGLQP
ncbi:hypothetical protein B0H13DRAFT_2340163 [Mycena leptocephala]|nr:hypothetical protein B0H13DRAFT_2340163 [Mycena leptocephala]